MKTNDSFPGVRIFDLSNEEDRSSLTNELKGGRREHPAALRLLSFILPDSPDSIGCRCVLVEPYVDRDYAVAYSTLHARAYRDYPRRTRRYHFFSNEFGFDDLFAQDKIQQAYLGYTVLSPIEPTTLGRTYISPRIESGTRFLTCARRDEVSLFGTRLSIEGAPFMEQDTRVSACATAAIWMSSSVVAKNFGDPARSASPADITELANRYNLGAGGPFPANGGLTVEQMLWALHELGFVPTISAYVDDESKIDQTRFEDDGQSQRNAHRRAHSTIYSYVESGLPPILTIQTPRGGHAVTIVGHNYDSAFDPLVGAQDVGHRVLESNEWCPSFIGHCDQLGPYLNFQIEQSTFETKGYARVHVWAENATDELRREIEEFYEGATLAAVIGPLLPRATLAPQLASQKGRKIIAQAVLAAVQVLRSHAQSSASDIAVRYLEELNSVASASFLRFRTYLRPSNDFKGRLDPSTIPGLSMDLAQRYRGHLLSRFVWVTELLEPHEAGTPFGNLRVLAEATFEPSSSPHDDDFMTIRLPGLFFSMPPEKFGSASVAEALQQPVPIENDSLYAPYGR